MLTLSWSRIGLHFVKYPKWSNSYSNDKPLHYFSLNVSLYMYMIFYIDINSYLLFIRYYFMSVELTFSDMDFIFLHVEFFGVISTKCEWMYITTE